MPDETSSHINRAHGDFLNPVLETFCSLTGYHKVIQKMALDMFSYIASKTFGTVLKLSSTHG